MINISEELTVLARRGWQRDLNLILNESHMVKESLLHAVNSTGGFFFCSMALWPQSSHHAAHVWVKVLDSGKVKMSLCRGKSNSSFPDVPHSPGLTVRVTRFAWYAKHIIRRLQRRADLLNGTDSKQIKRQQKMERKLARIKARL